MGSKTPSISQPTQRLLVVHFIHLIPTLGPDLDDLRLFEALHKNWCTQSLDILDIQTPVEKGFGPTKYTQNTFSGGIWMSTEYVKYSGSFRKISMNPFTNLMSLFNSSRLSFFFVKPRWTNLPYSHYILIEGNGLLDISAIGFEPVDLQFLQYQLAYQVGWLVGWLVGWIGWWFSLCIFVTESRFFVLFIRFSFRSPEPKMHAKMISWDYYDLFFFKFKMTKVGAEKCQL